MAAPSRDLSAPTPAPAQTGTSVGGPAGVPGAADGIVCPFCAHVRSARDAASACPKCTMEDTPNTRRSTGERIGPWFVLQRKNPTAPGLKFSVLLTLARRGHVTAKSIVRGPTTGQLWRFASEVKGLSRIFGICWHCRSGVSPDGTTCPRCKSAQEIPDDPDTFLENHASLPLMRDPAVNGTANGAPDTSGFTNGTPITADLDPSNASGLPAANGSRRPSRPPANRQPVNGLDDLADLTRALTLHRPPAQEAARPPRGRDRLPPNVTVEPILSASDLAAAFQLDGPRPTFFKRVRRATWTLAKVATVMLVVIGVSAAIVGYVKPAWRDAAVEQAEPYVEHLASWWNSAYTKVAGTSSSEMPPVATGDRMSTTPQIGGSAVPPTTPIKLDSASSGASSDELTAVRGSTESGRPTVVDRSPDQTADGAGQVTDAADVTAPSLSERATSAQAPAPQATVQTSPRTSPRSVTNAGSASSPQANQQAESPRVSADVPPAEPARHAPAEQPPTEPAKSAGTSQARGMSLEEAISQAAELRKSALDAEARKEWRAAVVIWEQIATLPEEARPSDLRVRLAIAKERMQQQ